jgi:hypothetical protein
MQQGGDVDTDSERSDAISLVEPELGNEWCRPAFESPLVLPSLDGVFGGNDLVLRILDPDDGWGCGSTSLAAVLSGALEVRFDLLPVREVPLHISNPFNQPRNCLIGSTFMSFVDLNPGSPRPFRTSLVFKRDATD